MLSPCRKICVYDSLRDLCAGCGRTLEEIENWLDQIDAGKTELGVGEQASRPAARFLAGLVDFYPILAQSETVRA